MTDNFSARLTALREKAGLTQRDLAKEASVSHTQISRYEAGAASPRPAVLVRLAAALNTTLEYLKRGVTEDESVIALEKKTGPLPVQQDVEFSREEYERLLKASELTGLSLPELTRSLLLLGIRDELMANRDVYEPEIDVDEHVAYYNEQLAVLGFRGLPSTGRMPAKKTTKTKKK